MAAKEKRTSLTKQLNKESVADNDKTESPDSVKKRTRKVLTGNEKTSSAPSSPVAARKRKQDVTPQTPQLVRNKKEEDDSGNKTPTINRSKKSFLEKELGDLLDYATGRNTPTFPRTRKLPDKEEDEGDKFNLSLLRRRDDKKTEIDDDNISVRSFSTRGRRSAVDDDVASVRSLNVRARKSEPVEEPKKETPKTEEKVKKIGRPKKIVPNPTEEKPKRKVGRPLKVKKVPEKVIKRIVKKPLINKAKLQVQKRIRSALMKKKMLMRAPLKKKAVAKILKNPKPDKPVKKIKGDKKTLPKKKTAATLDDDKPKNKSEIKVPAAKATGKRKRAETSTDSVDVYSFSDQEAEEKKQAVDGTKPKVRKNAKKLIAKPLEEKKRNKRTKSIHYESKRSPNDESVFIVQPRLGPKMRKKQLNAAKDVPSKTVAPAKSSFVVSPVTNYQLISKSFPPIVPKFKNPIVNPNFDHEKPIGPSNLPYIEKQEDTSSAGQFSNMPSIQNLPSEIILTPSGLVLSTSATSTIKTSSIIFQNIALSPDMTKAQLVYPGPVNFISSCLSSISPTAPAPLEQRRNSLPAVTPERLNTVLPALTEMAMESGETRNDIPKPSSNPCFIIIPDKLPKIPVAKNVSDLFMLKEQVQEIERNENSTYITSCTEISEEVNTDIENEVPKQKTDEKDLSVHLKRFSSNLSKSERRNSDGNIINTLKQTTRASSSINLTTPSVKHVRKMKKIRRNVRKITTSIESEVIFSDPETSYQSSPREPFMKKYYSSENISYDNIDRLFSNFKALTKNKKEKSDVLAVCSFSVENEGVLKELGLDSDLEKSDQDLKITENKLSKIKNDVDTVLRENKKLDTVTVLSPNRNDAKNYKTLTPPTVIDKLLEKNKSLKKAEEEGNLSSKFKESVRNLNENFNECSKKSLRDFRTKKFTKGVESKRKPDKFERRGSNPELFKNDSDIMPLRRITDENIQRSPSDVSHKIVERRMSLPLPSENKTDVELFKTDKFKLDKGTTKVISLTTLENGSKDGPNHLQQNDTSVSKGDDGLLQSYLKANDRRISCESSSSCSENFSKIIDELNILEESRKEKQVPCNDEHTCVSDDCQKVKKIRLSIDRKSMETCVIEDKSEDLVTKETILSALGLQSLKAAAQNAQKKKLAVEEQGTPTTASQSSHNYQSSYTGTLKTVIKIQRPDKKGNSKSPMKMIYKSISSVHEPSPSEDANSSHLSAGMDHDTDNTSREGSEEASDENKNGNGKAKSLVIPEKASSFSIHPGRMCSDVCTYCFGKFGLLDTPCHVAQLKDSERRRNILMSETHLTADSCLCDACFRHVDKKSNCPSFTEKKIKRKVPGRSKQTCCAEDCNVTSVHHIRRKSFMKLKKSLGKKLILDPVKLEKSQNSSVIMLCESHNYWIDYFMSCGICKRRLTNVNMYKLGSEVVGDLNSALSADGIPTVLTDKRFLCKVCRCYALLRVKVKDPADMSTNHRQFYESCRKRILYCHGIEVPDSGAEDEPNQKNGKMKHRKSKTAPSSSVNEGTKPQEQEIPRDIELTLEKEKDDDYEEDDKDISEVTHMNIPPTTKTNLDFGGVSISSKSTESSQNPTQIHVKLGNLNIGALGNLNIGQDARQGNRPEISIHQCFPTENELPLRAKFDFDEDESVKTPRKGFEKCNATIQFNQETKTMFKDLQMPYGNHSSFMRHLILLEKYFRSGDLGLARDADSKAVNYISSVQNRIRSYEGLHAPAKKTVNLTPSVSIVPQPKPEKFMPSLNPIKSEKVERERPPSVSLLPSRPFTLTPMPSSSQPFQIAKTTVTPVYSESPLSQMQATVQNLPGVVSKVPNLGNAISLTSVSSQNVITPPKPEVSIMSVQNNAYSQSNSKGKYVSILPPNPVLTSRIQENLRNLASTKTKSGSSTRAVILNRTVGGQKQSLVQVTTGGKTIHLTLNQFKRIQQMQMRKKQYLEHQAKMKQEVSNNDDVCPTDNLEVEIQEISNPNEKNLPTISEVRSLADEDTSKLQWDKTNGSTGPGPKPLSVTVTKLTSVEHKNSDSLVND